MDLSGKTAVITGCNRGIGEAIFDKFMSNGIKNVFTCNRSSLNCFEIRVGCTWHNIKLDLANVDSVKQAGKAILTHNIPIDILVNNAATIDTGLFQMTKIDNMKNLFDVNFFNTLLFTQYIVKSMVKHTGGSIINVASTSGLDNPSGRLAYSASKAALISATSTLSKELARSQIRVNAVAPGLTMTRMAKESTPEDLYASYADGVCLGRLASPEDIASVVKFLASDESSYVNGQTIRVDGGMK